MTKPIILVINYCIGRIGKVSQYHHNWLTLAMLNKFLSFENSSLGTTRHGHYNEVILLIRWSLNEVSLYVSRSTILTVSNN